MDDTGVFPASDLPGASKNWGRAVETRVKNLEKSRSRENQTLVNNLRAFGGQLDTQSSLLQEVLKGRTTHRAVIPSFQISATSGNSYPMVPRNFTLPAPYLGTRSATVNVSGVLSKTSSGDASITTWLEIYSGLNLVWRRQASLIAGLAVSSPPGWATPGFNDSFLVTIPAGQTDYQLRAYSTTFSGTVVAELQDIQIVVTYGDQV